MKILNLRFKNLNSLYGEWNIDFTDDSYLNDGIFAITGPTGAGKSTVLDAICLGLYGATPRLQKINSSLNDIMSRNTGECFSEVTFKTGKGTFRTYWAQHRAHRKADGKLTESSHEISNAQDGTIISNKKSEVKTVIEDITGMDIERFTRSTLLAQGSFSAFLKASSDQKSKILQQITGTEIYSKISMEVHRRKYENDQELKLLEAQIGETVLIAEDEEKQLIERNSVILNEENLLSSKVKDLLEQINTREAFGKIVEELKELKSSLISMEDLEKQLIPERLKLSKAKKALSINSLYIRLNEKLKQSDKVSRELIKVKNNLPEVNSKRDVAKKQFDQFESGLNNFRIDMEKEERLINRVRQLDFDIREVLGKSQESNRRVEDLSKSINKLGIDLSQLDEEQNNLSVEIGKIEEFLKDYSSLQDLQDQVANIKIKSGAVKSNLNRKKFLNDKLSDINLDIESLNSFFEKQQKNLSQLNLESDSFKTYIKDNSSEIEIILDGCTIKELRKEKEFLIKEISYIGKIINLEEERKRLEEGKPCPLCGSLDHPFSSDGIPEKNETQRKLDLLEERINLIEDKQEKEKQLEQSLKLLSDKRLDIENSIIEIQTKNYSLQNSKEEVLRELAEINESNVETLSDIKELLNIVDHLTESNYEDYIQRAQSDIEKIRAILDEKVFKDNRLLQISTEIKGLKSVIEQREEELSKEILLEKEFKNDLENRQEERIKLFGSKNTQEVELQLKRDLSQKMDRYNSLKEALHVLESDLRELNNRFSALDSEDKNLTEEVKVLGEDFDTRLVESDFNNREDFLTSIINENEIVIIENRINEFDKKLIEVNTGIRDREKKKKELEEQLSEDEIGLLKSSLLELEKKVKEIRSELGSINERIDSNNRAKEKFKEQTDKISRQKIECARWSKLHSLIGSNDGKKFRNFAQGLTFEVMVAHANRQLRKMSDRYLLVRDENMPLELNVIDNYIAGESRTSRNLSGGESFIISLALALGLSSMASDKVQVDSLFLDEGFGTLDKDSLDIALDTLSSLHQEGKMIGIISHVPAIKERIPTQISVLPLSGGRSKISGPGCVKY